MHTARGLHTASKFSALWKNGIFLTADFATQYANRVGSHSTFNIFTSIGSRSAQESVAEEAFVVNVDDEEAGDDWLLSFLISYVLLFYLKPISCM